MHYNPRFARLLFADVLLFVVGEQNAGAWLPPHHPAVVVLVHPDEIFPARFRFDFDALEEILAMDAVENELEIGKSVVESTIRNRSRVDEISKGRLVDLLFFVQIIILLKLAKTMVEPKRRNSAIS